MQRAREAQFLLAIGENPDDDKTRLAYADWLTSQADARGPLIRSHIQHPRQMLTAEQLEILGSSLGGLVRLRRSFIRRGLVEHIQLNTTDFETHGTQLVGPELPVLKSLHVTASRAEAARLAGIPQLAAFTQLRLQGGRRSPSKWDEQAATAFAQRAAVHNVEYLETDCAGTQKALAALLGARWDGLTRYRASREPIGVTGARALSDWERAPFLTHLSLIRCGLTASALKALASTDFRQLRHLAIEQNPKLEPSQIEDFIRTHPLPALELLTVSLPSANDRETLAMHDAAEARGLTLHTGRDPEAIRRAAADTAPHNTDLMNAIRRKLNDDGPRVVYADWVEEHGDPTRGEFIRLQCAADSEGLNEVQSARHKDVRARFGPVWTAPLVALGKPTPWNWTRGFVERARLGDAQLDEGGHLLKSETFPLLTALHCRTDRHGAARIAASPHLERVAHLALLDAANKRRFDGVAAANLGLSPHLSGLVSLDLARTHVGPRALKSLVTQGQLPSLTGLCLPEHLNKAPTVKELLTWEGAERLVWLAGLMLDGEATTRLLSRPWPKLETLQIRVRPQHHSKVVAAVLRHPTVTQLGLGCPLSDELTALLAERGVRYTLTHRWWSMVCATRS